MPFQIRLLMTRSVAGGDKRSLGLRLSSSMSVTSNAERLMGRISAGRAQSMALSEGADDADHSPKVGDCLEPCYHNVFRHCSRVSLSVAWCLFRGILMHVVFCRLSLP